MINISDGRFLAILKLLFYLKLFLQLFFRWHMHQIFLQLTELNSRLQTAANKSLWFITSFLLHLRHKSQMNTHTELNGDSFRLFSFRECVFALSYLKNLLLFLVTFCVAVVCLFKIVICNNRTYKTDKQDSIERMFELGYNFNLI